MFPHKRSLVEKYRGQPFVIIGVNCDRDIRQAQQAVKENNLNWRSFWNGPDGPRGPISSQWNVAAWPMTYLVDAKGIIRFRKPVIESMDKAIAALIEEQLSRGDH